MTEPSPPEAAPSAPAMSSRVAEARRALEAHRQELRGRPLTELFEVDPDRFGRLSFRLGDLFVDLSKERLTAETLELLVALARAAGLEELRDRMLAGEAVNATEGRPVLHTALRDRSGDPPAGQEIADRVAEARQALARFTRGVHGGEITGATGRPFTDLVHLGIGGSHLGPALAVEALAVEARAVEALAPGAPAAGRLAVHFVSNVDGGALAALLPRLDPETTLVTVASKSFGTQETLTNARTVRRWLEAGLAAVAAVAAVDTVDTVDTGPEAVGQHLVALTARPEAARQLGVPGERIFPLWDWVGGRYSLWSAVGLPIALAAGFDAFEELLEGAAAVDEHFRTAPLEENLPVLLGLLGVWNHDLLGIESRAVVPYDHRLRLLPAYLQQVEMESNGKGVDRQGRPVPWPTAPVIWGSTGTDGQHAYFQLLHQGTRRVACEVLVAARGEHRLPLGERGDGDLDLDLDRHHRILLAHCLAQTEALLAGRSPEALRRDGVSEGLLPHKVCPGDRPTTTILFTRLDPHTLGALLALYEHRVFTMGAVWGIHSFDQWGVELGKGLAGRLLAELEGDGGAAGDHDPSTRGLLEEIRRRRGDRDERDEEVR